MRLYSWKFFTFGTFLINLCLAVVLWINLDTQCDCTNPDQKYSTYIREINVKHSIEPSSANDSSTELSEKIIIVIREFEFFEHDLAETLQSIFRVLPSIKILVISDKLPYPPIHYIDEFKSNIKLISLEPSINTPTHLQNPLNEIDREHVFIFPDGIKLESGSQISEMLDLHFKQPHKIIAAPISDSHSDCLGLNVSLRYWTMKYGKPIDDLNCNALEGEHVFLVTKALLLQFGFPFERPFNVSLFIQAALLKIKIQTAKDIIFTRSKTLFNDPHLNWKHNALQIQRYQKLYKNFGIKKIVFPQNKIEWYGCNKKTPRCFGTVLNNMPEYLFEKRWTPPCCLENLRQTARYVFSILDKCGVRYWLEGGSLLGAVRTHDIIPWDYDVDIGIYKDDIDNCEWLRNALKQSIIDTQGFLWEKAQEGNFIRVQFSPINHLHVDIFPFYSRNGTMTKDTWFTDHRQDMEFPEHFLKPLYSLKFVGIKVPVPNNFKKFLELKFGKGVIENPEYPDPKIMKFSKKNL